MAVGPARNALCVDGHPAAHLHRGGAPGSPQALYAAPMVHRSTCLSGLGPCWSDICDCHKAERLRPNDGKLLEPIEPLMRVGGGS
jgi:hypothetical protein